MRSVARKGSGMPGGCQVFASVSYGVSWPAVSDSAKIRSWLR